MTQRHHTKDKGDLAVAKVQADLIERGALVLQPFTEHAPFDLVAYMDERFYRVQVKYRRLTRGSVHVKFRSTWADRHGVHTRPMPRDHVDVVAIYCPDTGSTYYVNNRDRIYREMLDVYAACEAHALERGPDPSPLLDRIASRTI